MDNNTNTTNTKKQKNALMVSLCYRGQDNYVKCEGPLKDVDIKGLLFNKLGFKEDEINVLTEAEATKTNSELSIQRKSACLTQLS